MAKAWTRQGVNVDKHKNDGYSDQLITPINLSVGLLGSKRPQRDANANKNRHLDFRHNNSKNSKNSNSKATQRRLSNLSQTLKPFSNNNVGEASHHGSCN